MNPRRILWLEKISVQATAVVVLGSTYFLLWRQVQPCDTVLPVSFFGSSEAARLTFLAGIAIAVAVLTGATTVAARPSAAIMTTIIGLGGLAMRSASFRALLWKWQGDPAHPDLLQSMFFQLSLEVLVLTCMAIVAGAVTLLTRRIASVALGRWVWRDPLIATLAPSPKGTPPPRGLLNWAMSAMGLGVVDYTIRSESDDSVRVRTTDRETLSRLAACSGMAGLLAATLAIILLRSDDRGQAIFAVLASFTVAVLIAHQVAPSPYPLVAWLLPPTVAIALYAFGSMSATTWQLPQDWKSVDSYARVLPIDWMCFGIGGGFLGYWISSRIHEGRHIEQQEAAAGD